jgi:two-component system sensor histidine kinase UhpB
MGAQDAGEEVQDERTTGVRILKFWNWEIGKFRSPGQSDTASFWRRNSDFPISKFPNSKIKIIVVFYRQQIPGMIKNHYGQLLIIFSFLFPPAFAQQMNPKQDSAYAFSLIDKAETLMERSAHDSALKLSLEALTFSQRKKLYMAEAMAHLQLSDIYYRKSFIPPMGHHDTAALKLGSQLKDTFVIALAYHRRGQYLMSLDRHKEAADYFDKALHIKFEKDQSKYTGILYNDIGFLHGLQGDLTKQADWYMKALRVQEKVHEPWGAAQTMSNLSATYNQIGHVKDAISYTWKSIAIREKMGDLSGLAVCYNNLSQHYLKADSLDQAIRAQQHGIRYAEACGVKGRLAHAYMTMALILNRQKKNREALGYELKSIPIFEEVGENNMLARRYIAVGILYKALKDSANALAYYQKAYDLSTALNNKYNLRDLYFNKTIFYKDHKDFYNAYEMYKKYILYRDSIINQETIAKIADVQARYETEKKDREILQLNTEQRIRELEIEKQKAIIAGNMLEAEQKENAIKLLSQARELQDVIIKQRDEELDKQALVARNKEQELLLAKQEKKLHEKQLQTQKQFRNGMIGGIVLLVLMGVILFNRYQLKKKLEQQKALLDIRNHIAADLHDEIGSTLTSINILSQVSQSNLGKDAARTSGLLQKITEQSHQIQQSMSDIVWTIKSDNDKAGNMIVRMREYLSHTLEPKNIDVEFDADESLLEHNFTMHQRKEMFLIFKEAVNNAVKYAHCSALKVQLSRINGHIALLVSDNGQGFDVNKTSSSNGLKNMRGRAKALNAQFAIESTPGKGTQILLEMPAT